MTPSYNLDLTPINVHVFFHLKKWLGFQQFEDSEEFKTAVLELDEFVAGKF